MPYYVDLDECLHLFDNNVSVICQTDLEAFFQCREALWSYSKKLSAISKKKGAAKYEKFVKQCDCISTNAVPDSKMSVAENSAKLRDFLGHVVNIEKNIFAISERLKELYQREYETELLAKISVCSRLFEQKETVMNLYDLLTVKQGDDPQKSVVVPKRSKYSKGYPRMPIEPKAPDAPILSKPGLFNKKRILAENAALVEQYEKEYAQHQEKLIRYKEELAVYNQKIAQIEAEQEQKQFELVEQAKLIHNKECEELRNKHLAAQQEYEQMNDSLDSIATPQVAALKCLQDEIAQAEELLRNLHRGKRKIFDTGVIFEKYNDFVAIASFYEYLSSGRCTTLEGPHGAYNLYENEIRMNAIVSQLADVIKGLTQIQKNQFVIYTAINEATNELAALNKATSKMNITLNAMHGELATISRNTEITAFYAKKNAELTDTLCFLTALN